MTMRSGSDLQLDSRMNRLWRGWLVFLAICVITVPLSIAYVDRPLADIFAARLAGTRAAMLMTATLAPLRPLVLAAFLFMIIAGLRSLVGRPLADRFRPLLVCTITLVLSIGAEFILKQIFGRGDVYPMYTRDGLYGFDFLHMHDGWWSFPSGTAMAIFSIVGVLQVWQSRWRRGAIALALVLCTVTLVLNYHWLSDMIAGVFVGLTVGYASASLQSTR